MYKVEHLPIAHQDFTDIALYISKDLNSPVTATNLVEKIILSIDNLELLQYSTNVYQPIKPLHFEYRKLIVDNYLVYYYVDYVDELQKNVTIARVIYTKRDYTNIIK